MNSQALQLPGATSAEAVERRFAFAAWPQAIAHPSWLEQLSRETGLPLQAVRGPEASASDRLVAEHLLRLVNACGNDGTGSVPVPPWVLLPFPELRRHLGCVAGLPLQALLRDAMPAAQARRWDRVLGPGVRRVILCMAPTAAGVLDAADRERLTRQALDGLVDEGAWLRFCMAFGLAALSGLPAGVQGRFRLMWPASLHDVVPLPAAAPLAAWMSAACQLSTRLRTAASPSASVSVLA